MATEPNDLFISYSHIDNRPWGAGQHRWVSAFHNELETRLQMLLGRDVRVWRDDKMNGNDELTDRIGSELRRSRAFLSIISPRYLRSDWCIRELRLFQEQSGPGRHRSPFFKVVKTPVERSAQPPEIQEFRGYDFFQESPSGRVHEFYPSRDEDSAESKGFWQLIDDLAQDVKRTIDDGLTVPPVQGAGAGKTVFLAETTGDMRTARENVKRELNQRGYRIVPDRTLPSSADELLPMLESDLGQACLTVHPVGARYGFVPEGEDRSIVELQIDAATAHNGHSQHVIWVAPEVGPSAEERQEQFLEKLRRVYTERLSTELLERKPLEVLKTRIAEKLEPRKTPAPPVASNLQVYLICERPDLPGVKPLAEYLRAEGFSVNRPLLDGDEQELLQDHREILTLCDAVILYYGSGRQAWLRAKQRDLWKAPGWGRIKPMLGQAVYIAPPPTPEKVEYSNDDFLVIDGAGGSPQALSAFIEEVRSAAGAAQ
jgi:TIR domain